ncbi:protein fantom-like isoform X2 [Dreissena polymorpha]|uniref:protein fantom-like isoform X2 n=1 Tax=Dreissena polymorpha TaxID=45954 RepID=UPI00226400F6|nr:protein fantom-like isoform X2 [Dreissena polymorpha]
MTDVDHIPVKDTNIGGLEQKAAQQRRLVSKWERDVLEDKYLRMSEENIILKKHARKQEDKIKRMATKLLRLVNDKKKTVDGDIGTGPPAKKIRDIETEEKMAELHEKISRLEKQSHQYREKLELAKQQLASASKRPQQYPHAMSRINTGIHKTAPDPRLTKNMRVTGPPQDHRTRGAPGSPSRGQSHTVHYSALEDTRMENHRLESLVAQQNEQINMYELEMRQLREQVHLKEKEYEEDLTKIKHQITAEQRTSVQENIDMIKLQREVKEKSTKFLMLQEKYSMLEENLRSVKRSHDTLLMEMESVNMQLKEEQNRSLALQNELKMGSAKQHELIQLNEQVNSLKREIEILKDANEKLVGSAFDLEREREWRQRENALKVQIAQLEATLKADLGEKGGILDKLAVEKDQYDRMAQEHRTMQLEHYQLREKYDDLVEKMKFFTKESAVDFTEIEEALVLVKQKKQKLAAHPEFLQRVDEELDKDAQRRLLDLQAEYAETVHELEKTRNMLVVQHKINKDYQHEVTLATNKMEEVKKEYEMKLDEYARMLDMRQARIKKLESQLRDVAYGTRQYKLMPPTDDVDEDVVQFDETIHLERGQNLFEIHVSKVMLSNDATRLLGDEEPSLFCTWEFFEYEIQSTPVIRGSRPEFDFTSQYIVKVDDFFLHYLQKDSCTLELHQSFGQDFTTVAACQLTFREIFDKTHGRIHGTATLTGISGSRTGIGFGTVEYWVRLRVPMDQALRLYKERTKALGYMTTNIRAADQALQALDDEAARRPPDNVNELHIKLIRCTHLKARRDNVQPSPYCVYQFFDYNDHDSVIINSSNNPEFNDHKTYPVPMTSDLDQYLKTMPLKIFVFDDTDPEQAAYLGIADIPLIPLAHDKGVQGIFELRAANGHINGTIEVELRWQFTYMPPSHLKAGTQKQPELEASPQEPPERLVTFKEEPAVQARGSQRLAAKFPGPSAHSTPVAKPREEPKQAKLTARRQLTEPSSETDEEPVQASSIQRATIVNEAVSHAVSNILPGMDTMTTLNETLESPAPISPAYREEESLSDAGSVRSQTSSVRSQTGSVRSQTGSVRSRASSQGSRGSRASDHHSDRRGSRGQEELQNGTLRSTMKSEDTMFGDSPGSVSEEIVSPDPSQRSTLRDREDTPTESESETPPIESDSEGIMIAPKPSKRKQKSSSKPGNSVTVAINHISLEENSPAMENESIRQLFVEYKFLGIDPAETETPFSLPKPKPYHNIQFNFSKTFHVDFENNYQRRQYLASMLLPSDPDDGRIRFTLVSEPPEDDQDGDCEDVGVALVNVRDILKDRHDIIEKDIDIVDIETEQTVIGSMNLTVQCLAALESVEKEMKIEGTY